MCHETWRRRESLCSPTGFELLSKNYIMLVSNYTASFIDCSEAYAFVPAPSTIAGFICSSQTDTSSIVLVAKPEGIITPCVRPAEQV